MVTKAVSDQFGKGGIADQMIRFNGFPFLEHEDQTYNVPGMCFRLSFCSMIAEVDVVIVSSMMERTLIYLPSSGMRLNELGWLNSVLLVLLTFPNFHVCF